MAIILDDLSRTFGEYLLLPGLTKKNHLPSNVSLRVPLQRVSFSALKTKRPADGPPSESFRELDYSKIKHLNIPIVSSAMQAVSGPELAIALARKGGMAFIFCSQAIEEQAQMISQVKEHKAGFKVSDACLPPSAKLRDALELRKTTGHSTVAITEGGRSQGKFLGLLTSKEYWEYKDKLDVALIELYVPREKLVYADEKISLSEANELLWKNKLNCLPILDSKENLKYLVFRKDYFDHKSNPEELLDRFLKRLLVGAALNTHDYKERAPALVAAGVDCLCLDSSDGYSEWQADAATWLRKQYSEKLAIGGGNVVSADGFRYLVEQGQVDFVKVGIGGGSICITREQKGIGRGQASAVLDVVAERNRYFKDTGIYIPICSDGAINNDTHLIMALALGADFVMMGRYFAMCAESPPNKVTYKGRLYKPYWGEGSNRARNWQRYKQSEKAELIFEEGVDAYVPFGGYLKDKIDVTTAKIKSSMCNCGVLNIAELQRNARVTRISELSIVEGGTSSVEQLDHSNG